MNISEEVISTTARAWSPSMAADEDGAFLNQLLEADEARTCAVLVRLLLEVNIGSCKDLL